MFRALPFIAVRQQHHEAVGAQPFRFARGNELIDHHLRAVGEVTELPLPQDERVGRLAGIAIFEAQHAELAERTVEDLKAAVEVGQRDIFVPSV